MSLLELIWRNRLAVADGMNWAANAALMLTVAGVYIAFLVMFSGLALAVWGRVRWRSYGLALGGVTSLGIALFLVSVLLQLAAAALRQQ